MNILNQLTIKNIKLNKRITAFIIIGIIISTIYLNIMVAVRSSLINMGIKYTKEIEKNNYHFKIEDFPINEVSKLKNNSKIEDVYIIQSLDTLDSSYGVETLNKDFIEAYSKKTLNDLFSKQIRGRIPKNENEILIGPKNQWGLNEVEYNIGDSIDFRIVTQINYDEDYDKYIYKSYKKEYKIVGVFVEEEEYNNRYITCFDENKFKGNVDVYVRCNKDGVKDIYKTIGNVLNLNEEELKKRKEDYGSVIHINEKYEISINKNLVELENNRIYDCYVLDFGTSEYYVFAIVSSLIIVITSIVFLSNNFYIFFTKNIKQYGMLKSIGTTKKQIKKIIFSEATAFMIIAVPLGMIFGILTSIIFINICNVFIEKAYFVENLCRYSFSIYQVIYAIGLEAIIIYLSAFIVAIKLAKKTPMELIKNSYNLKIKSKKFETPSIFKKIFGVYGDFAFKSIERNRINYRSILLTFIVSVAVFIILFNNNNIIVEQNNYKIFFFDKVEEYNISLKIKEKNLNSIKSVLNSDNIQKYSAIKYGSMKIDNNNLNKEYINAFGLLEDHEEYIRIYSMEKNQFIQYIKDFGLNYDETKNDAILVYGEKYYLYHQNEKYLITKMNKLKRYDFKVGDLCKGIDENKNITFDIASVVEKTPFGLSNEDKPFLVTSDEVFNKYFENKYVNVYIRTNKPDEIKTLIGKKLNDEYYEFKELSQNEISNSNIGIIYNIFLYTCVMVIFFIIIINLVNTVSMNLELRKIEFAKLKSIGITQKEIKKIIIIEYFIIGLKSIIVGLIIGFIGTYLLYIYYGRFLFIILKSSPLIGVAIAIIIVSLIINLLIKYSIHKLNKQSIIETIRNENI